MKTKPFAISLILLPAAASGQIIGFYEPDMKVRREGIDTGLLSVAVTNDVETDSGSSGNVTWDLGAGGFVQARASIPLALLVDAQLAAYTELQGDSLIFGREITTEAEVLGVLSAGSLLQNTLNDVLGASVIYDWEAEASLTGLTIAPDQLYQVDFTVTAGAGLPVGLLEYARFGITTPDITSAFGASATALDVLGLLTLGTGGSTGNFSFQFQSSSATDISELNFNFEAGSTVGVNALGGTAGNQNFLTYSGFSVTAIPEMSSSAFACLGLCFLISRRKK